MSNESSVKNLLNGVEFDDARLYTLLDQLIGDFYKLQNQINPPTSNRVFGTTGVIVSPDTVDSFTAFIYNNNIKLAWLILDGINIYEIRYKAGNNPISDWDTASVLLRTSTSSADINPVAIPITFGSHTFFIKSIDVNGNETEDASIVVISIPTIPAPVISLSTINNFVLLNWTNPVSTFLLDHFNIYKNNVLVGTVSGTFESFFEVVGGTYTYTIEPVDIVGNVGDLSSGAVATVRDPTDYILYDSIISALAGTPTNAAVESVDGNSYLLACIDIAKTFENHFIDNVWASPQAQVTAGYEIYIEPAKTTGSYVEIFDFGGILSNLIVTLIWNTIPIVGTVSVATSTVEYSTDAITWSTPVVGSSVFSPSLRYVRFTMNFVGADDKSLAYFYNITCLLDVRREQDGGSQACLAADVGGTTVTLNKAFKSIDSITVTPVSTTEKKAVYDFAFPVNPTTFKVLVFDAAGARVNATITWIARGIF